MENQPFCFRPALLWPIKNVSLLYISGEESTDQIKLRAERLNLSNAPVQIATATNVRDIIATLNNQPDIKVLVIDSIQTMYSDLIDSAPGTVSQVRNRSP